MASYLDNYEREGLPSIHRNSYSERRVMFEDAGVHKYRSRSPRAKSPILRSKSPTLRSRSPTSGLYTLSDSLITPRPPSPTYHSRRAMGEVSMAVLPLIHASTSFT